MSYDPEEALTREDAVEWLRERMQSSRGAAEANLAQACVSGEVRSWRQTAILSDTSSAPAIIVSRVAAAAWSDCNHPDCIAALVSLEDLEYWARGSAELVVNGGLPKYGRNPDDHRLALEIIEGVRSRRWPNKHQAAIELAAQVKGHSLEAKVRRLERLVTKIDKTSRNTSKD